MHGIGRSGSDLVELPRELFVQIRLKALGLSLGEYRVAEEFAGAEQVARGVLIVSGSPVARVDFKVLCIRVGVLARRGKDVVIDRRQILIGREEIVYVLIVSVVGVSAITAVLTIPIVLVLGLSVIAGVIFRLIVVLAVVIVLTVTVVLAIIVVLPVIIRLVVVLILIIEILAVAVIVKASEIVAAVQAIEAIVYH
jgi:hypothetical protein